MGAENPLNRPLGGLKIRFRVYKSERDGTPVWVASNPSGTDEQAFFLWKTALEVAMDMADEWNWRLP